ncbi:hypothetical protein LJB77_02630 [Ruminococcaceae bacterium OttesenSCG-928-N02]|nr:hypothetical protein [Ruminococcaceae bacterium OttesenSCG-928-N02]
MGKSIKALLEEKGPMLSGDLAKLYELENKTNNVNARQAISRARSPVQKNKLIPFQNNQVFIYLEKQFMSQIYWDSLIASITNYSKIADAFIRAMTSQDGIISKNILAAYTMSPIDNLKGHKRHDVLLEQLTQSNIIVDYNDEQISLSNRWYPSIYSNGFSHAKAIELTKKMVLSDFNDLARNTNTISYNSGKFWSNFAHFQWGYTAPSYLQGISSWDVKNQTPVPGFIIADVVLQRNASVKDISFFIEKVNTIKSFRNISNFIPILIIYGVDAEALELLKKNNIAIAFIDKVFGREYVELLDDLINVITNATVMVSNAPDKVDKIFDALAKMDGRYNNIVGDMFELMVAELYRTLGVSYLEVNKAIPATETVSHRPKEIDVMVDRNGTIIIAECKATVSMLNEGFVEKWLTEKIVDIHKFLTGIYSNKKFEYQLWSTGGFTPEAEARLRKAQAATKKYSIAFYNKNEMVEYAKNNGAQNFVSRIRKHFN